jgi:hypothetical protein
MLHGGVLEDKSRYRVTPAPPLRGTGRSPLTARTHALIIPIVIVLLSRILIDQGKLVQFVGSSDLRGQQDIKGCMASPASPTLAHSSVRPLLAVARNMTSRVLLMKICPSQPSLCPLPARAPPRLRSVRECESRVPQCNQGHNDCKGHEGQTGHTILEVAKVVQIFELITVIIATQTPGELPSCGCGRHRLTPLQRACGRDALTGPTRCEFPIPDVILHCVMLSPCGVIQSDAARGYHSTV